jgi:hypothetical protein
MLKLSQLNFFFSWDNEHGSSQLDK